MNKLSIIAVAAAIAAAAAPMTALADGKAGAGKMDPVVLDPYVEVADDDGIVFLPWLAAGGAAVAIGLALSNTSSSSSTGTD